MNRLLLVMPFFMGYHSSLQKELEKYYKVTIINSDQYDKKILNIYYKCGKVRWGLRHCNKNFRKYEQEKVMNQFLDEFVASVSVKKDYYQVVFCINGAYTPDFFYKILKERNPSARFIYYAWDDIGNLFKRTHLQFFDEKFMYNISDCQRYNAHYLPMFIQEFSIKNTEEKVYDLAMIFSAHSNRRKMAEILHEKYSKKYRMYIYIYDPDHPEDEFSHKIPLTYNEYMDVLNKSRVVFDFPSEKQKGPTTRFFDALVTKTKVITTNDEIVKYPIYSDNIYITSRKSPEIDDEFMSKQYKEIEYRPLTINQWTIEIIK